MNSITGFLKKFLVLENNKILKTSRLIEVINQETGCLIDKSNLEVKGETVKLKTNSVLRNEIFMHRESIESTLRQEKIFLKIL